MLKSGHKRTIEREHAVEQPFVLPRLPDSLKLFPGLLMKLLVRARGLADFGQLRDRHAGNAGRVPSRLDVDRVEIGTRRDRLVFERAKERRPLRCRERREAGPGWPTLGIRIDFAGGLNDAFQVLPPLSIRPSADLAFTTSVWNFLIASIVAEVM